MEITELAISDVKVLRPKRHGDERGFFSETFNARLIEQAGLPTGWVQDNHSLSRQVGTVRGLHYQTPPFAQDKLVRVVRGRIFDVAVDLRRSSDTYGQYVAEEISAENWCQFFVPKGFAHGFCTLEPDTEVLYKVTDFYAPDHDFGIAWDDPTIGIDWPGVCDPDTLSGRDRTHPHLADLGTIFE
ncbi:dTDP-4-dehydrorhamnose 3,5-epimerase [Amorphus sp. 3PC139-8]|uniref:dTDP-4-dehydrorhamnose 3,5-epimerase n=1 Tax=Amorphus sp. 3PC139-8 TaxID=2735676 RepID=UPI00345C6EA6